MELLDQPQKHAGGRPKGATNASTLNARRAIADFVEGNVDRLNGWLERIAEDNPLAAFDRFMSVVEYHIPKLARTEITGKDGEKFNITINGLETLPVKPCVDAEFTVLPSPLPAIENKPLPEIEVPEIELSPKVGNAGS